MRPWDRGCGFGTFRDRKVRNRGALPVARRKKEDIQLDESEVIRHFWPMKCLLFFFEPTFSIYWRQTKARAIFERFLVFLITPKIVQEKHREYFAISQAN